MSVGRWQRPISHAAWNSGWQLHLSPADVSVCSRSRANHVIFSNLMAKDDFKNLGFKEKDPPSTPKPAAEAEKGVKGELQW